MSAPSFFSNIGSSPLGTAERSGNTSGNVGIAGSALLPTITAELRGEFSLLLSTLARSGSGISSTYVMELFFTLIRFDAILHSDERHLFVSTSQQLITKQLKQLQTVHKKVNLLEENITFVQELIERCAALEVLCGSHEEIEDADDDGAAAGRAAGATAPDVGVGTEEDESGEAGSTANDHDATGEQTAQIQQQQQQRTTTSSAVRTSQPVLNFSSISSTTQCNANSAQCRKYFSFDDGLDGMINKSNDTVTVQQQQQQLRKVVEEKKETNVVSSTGGDTNTFTVSSSTVPPRQQHAQRPLPMPLVLVSDTTPTAASASERSRTSNRPRRGSQHSSTRAPSAESSVGSKEGEAAAGGESGTNANPNVLPAVFTGVQHALQEHFRQNVKKTLTGTSWGPPTSVAESAAPHGPGASERSTSPAALADTNVSDTDKGKTFAAAVDIQQAPPSSSAGLPRHPFSMSQISNLSNTNNSFYPGLLTAASANHLNILSVVESGALAIALLGGGGGGGSGGVPYSPVYSPAFLEPVNTPRVWDRMFWDFLDGRTATADLVVLLCLLNDGNAALATLQASEMNSKRAGSEATTAGVTTNNNMAKAGKKPSGHGISGGRRLSCVSLDTISRSPLVTAMPTPDCGALPLMEALKRTGSYAELIPPPVLSNMSIASAAATGVSLPLMAGGAAAATGGDNGSFARIRSEHSGEFTEDDGQPVPLSGTTDAEAFFPSSNAIVNVYATGGNSSMTNNFSNLDSSALRPASQQWVSLDDYAKAEEARLHRDFWAHIPAILVTLSEGMMYGDSKRRGNSHKQHVDKTGNDGSSDGARRQRKRSTQTAAAAAAATVVVADTGGEVADAPANASSFYGSIGLPGIHNSAEDGERWGDATPQHEEVGDDTEKEEDYAEAEEAAEAFVSLHPPSGEALQLLPTFSPLLRNYADAVGKLFQVAPDYARSTQAQHTRALANVAVQQIQMQQQQQQQQLGTSGLNDANAVSGFTSESEIDEDGIAVPTTAAGSAALENEIGSAVRRLTRAATHRSSVADMQESNETAYYYYANNVERRGAPPPPTSALATTSGGGRSGGNGTGKSAKLSPLISAAGSTTAAATSSERADLGLLGEGSRTEVRPVDVIMYALVMGVFVQCAMPLEQQQQRKLMMSGGGKNGSGSDGHNATIPQMSTQEPKTSSSDGGHSPAGGLPTQQGLGWPGGPAFASCGLSFAGDGGRASDSAAEDERATNLSLANASLNYATNTAPGNFSGSAVGWWNTSGGNGTANTSFGLTPRVLRPNKPQYSNAPWGNKCDNASFNFSGSPTEAALAFLRGAHEAKAHGRGCERTNEMEKRADSATHAAPLSMRFDTQDVLMSANEFSGVSLPNIMKAELLNLQAQLQSTRDAVQRMEAQVRGELALLLFRVLSMVLDWLMPAVYVADLRIWLFYRKWCCDLYRVLCTDLALLNEFRKLLNQSGVAVTAGCPGSGDTASNRRHGSRRGSNSISSMSAAVTPAYESHSSDGRVDTPPRRTLKPGSPVLFSVGSRTVTKLADEGRGATQTGSTPHAEDREGVPVISPFLEKEPHHDDNADEGADEEAEGNGSKSSNNRSHSHSHQRHHHHHSADSDEADFFSFVLPGSSLAVSVPYATPSTQPNPLNLLTREGDDLRGEALADVAAFRAAQALLSDEGKVVPLPRPFLITKLVAAALRGIDADTAESLLWVVGQATEMPQESAEDEVTGDPTLQRVPTDATGVFVDSLTGVPCIDNIPDRGQGALTENVHSTAQWKSQRPRHSLPNPSEHSLCAPKQDGNTNNNENNSSSSGSAHSHAISSHLRRNVPHHGDPSAVSVIGRRSPFSKDFDDDDVSDSDSDDVQRLGRRYGAPRWYGEELSGGSSTRRHGTRRPTVPATRSSMASPASTSRGNNGGGLSAISSASIFPLMPPRTSYTSGDLSMNSLPAHQQHQQPPSLQAAAAPDGPMLVHHHRFRYPSVSGYVDVAQLYLNTLEDAELLLSPHDPIYASLVLSTADLHMHCLHDCEMAATLVNSYLADVGEEQIQGQVWDLLPTTLIPIDATGGSTATGGGANTTASSSSSAAVSPMPGRGFSVTRVRQGNAGAGAGRTLANAMATSASSLASSTPHPPAPQQPYVPMVTASWNNEGEKNEFLATLRILRQMQMFFGGGVDGK